MVSSRMMGLWRNASINTPQVLSTMDSGRVVSAMAKVLCSGQTAQSMRAAGILTKQLTTESLHMLMAEFMKETGSTIRLMVMEFTLLMALSMMVLGNKIIVRAKV